MVGLSKLVPTPKTWFSTKHEDVFSSDVKSSSIPFVKDGGYYVGTFVASCGTTGKPYSFFVHDYGQYPWGRSSTKGTLAYICRLLGIDGKSGGSNCCLFIHLLVAILVLRLVSVRDIVGKHKKLVNKYLRLKEQQSEHTVVNEVLSSLKPGRKTCVRFICRIENDFIILKDCYGSKHSTKIFIGWIGSHFFLAKRNLQSVSFQVMEDTPSHSTKGATDSTTTSAPVSVLPDRHFLNFQESDFGTPPDSFDFLEFDDPFSQEGPSPPF